MLRIRDVYPGSRILIFTHPGSRDRWKKISCHIFLYSHKFHKIVNYFSFEVLKKKIWANFQRIIELFTKKIVKKRLKIWSLDPRSGIRKKPIPDPGSRGQKAPNPGSGSATLLLIGFCCAGYKGLGDTEAWREVLHHARVGILRRLRRHRQREPCREVHAGGSGQQK